MKGGHVHVLAGGPVFGDTQHDGTGEIDGARLAWEDAHDVGAPSDLLKQARQAVGRA